MSPTKEECATPLGLDAPFRCQDGTLSIFVASQTMQREDDWGVIRRSWCSVPV